MPGQYPTNLIPGCLFFPAFPAHNSQIRSAYFTMKACSHQDPVMHSLATFLSVLITITSCCFSV